MISGFFITGTDTGVGKTEVAAALAAVYAEQGIAISPRKPAESGCVVSDAGKLIPHDAQLLQQMSQTTDSLETICPYRFEPAVSPERAAQLAGKPLSLDQLMLACDAPEGTFRLVEGAGGFYSPIAENALNSDLAKALQLPVILVAKERLGVINQILLAREAILNAGLELFAVVLNGCDFPETQTTVQTTNFQDEMANLQALSRWVAEPVIPLPEIQGMNPWKQLVRYLLQTVLCEHN